MPDAGDETYIVILTGLWTRPEHRRRGVARRLVEAVGEFGLPVYVAFGNPNMERWFEAEHQPDDSETGPWQEELSNFETYAEDPWPGDTPGGNYRWQLTCSARRAIATGEFYFDREATLGAVLFTPARADWFDLDGGGGETDLSDTAFADDRRYGYELTITELHDTSLDIGDLDDTDAYESEEAAYEAALQQAVTITASGHLHVINIDYVNAYAAFRRMLRTGDPHGPEPQSGADAVRELLVDDLHQDFVDVVELTASVEKID